MKKVLAILLAMVLMLAMFTGCAKDEPVSEPDPTPAAPVDTPEDKPEDNQPEEPKVNPATDGYPKKNITIVVPSSAGSGYDTMARKAAEILPKYLGNDVIVYVENLKASNGAEGWTKVYGANPDGYTLVFHGAANPWVVQEIYEFPYDIAELTALCTVTDEVGQIMCAPDSEIQTFADFVEKYKDSDEVPVFATTGAGQATQTQAIAVLAAVGIEARYVNYGGTGEAVGALERGECEFMYLAYDTALSYLESGMARSIVITGPERQEAFPDVPTIFEIDAISEEDAQEIALITTSHRAMWAPPGMDAELAALIADACEKTFTDPEYIEWAASIGRKVAFTGGEEAAAKIQATFEAQKPYLDLFKAAIEG